MSEIVNSLIDTVPTQDTDQALLQAEVSWNLIIRANDRQSAEKVLLRFAERNAPVTDVKFETYWKIAGHFQVFCQSRISSLNPLRKWIHQLNVYAPHWHIGGMVDYPAQYQIDAHQSEGISLPGLTFIHSTLTVFDGPLKD